jgi:hypothetical protein
MSHFKDSCARHMVMPSLYSRHDFW